MMTNELNSTAMTAIQIKNLHDLFITHLLTWGNSIKSSHRFLDWWF